MKRLLLGVMVIGLAACSTSSPESDPAYISPNHYDSYNCNQISAEMHRISNKADQMYATSAAGQVLSTALTAFAISQGYGVSGGNDDVAYRRLYNQYEVLEQTYIKKECGM